MPLEMQAVSVNFAQGLDTNTDPKQVPAGKFLSLVNTVFTQANALSKRNGFGKLTAPPVTASYATTLNNNLTAVGTNIQAYSANTKSWVTKGNFESLALNVLPIGRSSLNQVQCDSVIGNGLLCSAFTELNNATFDYKYSIQDAVTGQFIINPTLIPVSSGAVSGSPRVFLLGSYFIIAFTNTISSVAHLQYIAISTTNPTLVTPNADLASAYIPSSSLAWDGVVTQGNLYFAYNNTTGSQSIKVNYLSANLFTATPVSFTGATDKGQIVSLSADGTYIYVSFYDSGGSTGYVCAVDNQLNTRMNPTQIISSGVVYNITSVAVGGVVTVVYEVGNNYGYDSTLPSHYLNSCAVTLPATVTTGTVGATNTFLRSVGLASKACYINSTIYMLVEYASSLQSTYFLVDIFGNIVSRFAYENGGALVNPATGNVYTTQGYLPYGLPQAQVIGQTIYVAYLYKDLIQTQNATGLVQSIGNAGTVNVYSQTGINLMGITFTTTDLVSAEIANTLNLTGGMLWSYDGQTICEQGFHVFPDNVECTWSTTGGGAVAAQPDGSTNAKAYYYQVIYQWTDANGNLVYSAPSVPTSVTTTGTGAGNITVNIPTLRLSYKSGVKIILYRWSVAQQEYYQITSITSPTLNNPSVDYITYVDTLADSSILGNSLIYTTGGVVEDTPGPACIDVSLFDDRAWVIYAEDQNMLAYSKQVIEGTPVEMSDLFTFYVAPSTGAQGSTGKLTFTFPMDDALILFKPDAIYWINGTGPDNTGANSGYSQPIFVTSNVGSTNKKSCVMTDAGLMFQSDKGIWLLPRGRGQPIYIGLDVRAYNQYQVNSAVCVPGTTQVRFTLSNGVILMYDYFYAQWGVFQGVHAISSCLYNGLHTLIDLYGNILQETPGVYLDNGNPVTLSFTTGPIGLAGVNGYQRLIEFILLASYVSPHQLQVQVSFDYGPAYEQAIIPVSNQAGVYGSDAVYGQSLVYGGPNSLEQWRAQVQNQKCQSFQISITELPSFTNPGAGFVLSAITAWVGVKSAKRPIRSSNTVGSM